MSPQLQEFTEQALKLPPRERASLAEQLIASLDELTLEQNEQLWAEEAERRYREYQLGMIPARSAEDALRDARASLA